MDDKTLAFVKHILSRFPKQELLGLNAKVINSTDKGIIGRKGIVINETKNMLQFRDKSKKFMVEKKNCVFEFTIEKERITSYKKLAKSSDFHLKDKIVIEIEGKMLSKRPEERVKKKLSIK